MSAVVGILGFQGCIEPHEAMLTKLGVSFLRVRTEAELNKVDRLILPGGESTTMLKLLKETGLFSAIKEFGNTCPVWGICAGAILIAKEVFDPQQESLGLIDVRARRNFYGSQRESFTKKIRVSGIDNEIEVHFIRAPLLEGGSKQVQVLAKLEEQPIFFAQGKIWACSFHVELGKNTEIHEQFLEL